MNRFLLPLGAFGLLAVVLAIGIKHSPEKGLIASPLLGKPAPQFELPVLADSSRKLRTADLKGRWYIFNVWGTWCPSCRDEHGFLLEVRQSGQIPVIGLDWKDEDAEAQQYLSQAGNPYDVVAVDHDGRTAIDWGVYGAPETFLVNPEGRIVYKYVGALTREVWAQKFAPKLPTRTASSS